MFSQVGRYVVSYYQVFLVQNLSVTKLENFCQMACLATAFVTLQFNTYEKVCGHRNRGSFSALSQKSLLMGDPLNHYICPITNM